jgi:iron complex outermembrane receptor protein
MNLVFQVNNIFNKKYEPSGYTYNYIYGRMLSVNNYYFPMAGTNFMAGVHVKL